MNMNPKEKFIEDALKSIDGINTAIPTFALKEKIIDRLTRKPKVVMMNSKLVWSAAASIALLIGLNVFSIVNSKQSSTIQQESKNVFAQEYFSYLTNTNL